MKRGFYYWGAIENNMENEPRSGEQPEIKIIEGREYRKVYSGYSVRQYYSHETPEKGPGPGWDFRSAALEKYNVKDVSELPDEPYYSWEEVG